jgi:hypothetical protein
VSPRQIQGYFSLGNKEVEERLRISITKDPAHLDSIDLNIHFLDPILYIDRRINFCLCISIPAKGKKGRRSLE